MMTALNRPATADLRRLARGRANSLRLIAVLIVPLLAGLFQQTAHTGEEVRAVKAAIVNEDKIVTATGPDGKETPVAVGRVLTDNLVNDDSDTNFDWVITNRDDAKSGLKDGTYGAVLTIPRSLSAAAISTAGDDPTQGTIQIQTDDSTSYLNGEIAQSVGRAATDGVNETITEAYLGNLYVGFETIKTSVSKAATGAGDLSAGARQLDDGVSQIDTGVGQLSGGLSQLSQRTARLPSDAQKLSDGSSALANGSAKLSVGTAQLADGTTRLADGLKQFGDGMDQLVASCPGLVLYQRYCDGVAQARDGAKQIAAKSVLLRDGANDLNAGSSQLAGGARRLSDGTAQFADQAPQLHDAIAQAATGANRLKSGTAQLSEGAGQLAGGAGQLQNGLSKGADQVPTYSAGERETLSKVVARPVAAQNQRSNALESASQSRIPYIFTLSAFLGALALIGIVPTLSGRMLVSAMSAWGIAKTRVFTTWPIAAVQSVVVLAAMTIVTNAGIARPTQFVAIAMLAALTFATLVQAIITIFGGPGAYVAAGWMFVQVMTLDPLKPAEALSGPARFVNDLSPMAAAIDGLTAAQTGGGSITSPLLQLLVWTSIAFLATVAAIHRRRTKITGPPSRAVTV